MSEIKKALEAYDVTADRKSLYDDLEALRVPGIDVVGEKGGGNYHYHVGKKQFEIAELKLLMDVAMSDQFLGWIFAIGPKVKIRGPEEDTTRFREKLEGMREYYNS